MLHAGRLIQRSRSELQIKCLTWIGFAHADRQQPRTRPCARGQRDRRAQSREDRPDPPVRRRQLGPRAGQGGLAPQYRPGPAARVPKGLRPVPEAAVGAVKQTLHEQGLPAAGGMTFLQARTANEVLKAQERRLRLQQLKGELVDRARAVSLVFRLARDERDAWTGWPARIAAVLAAELGCDTHDCRPPWIAMSASISTSWPSPGSSSAEPDGSAALAQAWAQGLRPEPALSVATWADRHRVLSPRASAEPGRWRTARTPYLGEIMAALSPSHPAQRIVFMKGAQVGGTEAGNNWLGFLIHHAPGPALAVQPTVELAKRFSRQRVATLIEETPALRERVAPARSRDSGNTVLSQGIPRRHPGDDRRQQCRRPALAAGALSVPRRGRRLPGLGRRGGRSGGPGRGQDADLRPPAQDLPGVDPDHPGRLADRARVPGQRPAPVLRALPALRADAVAALRAPALGQGPARDRSLLVRGLRAADRRAAQGRDAARPAAGGRPPPPPTR